MKINQLKISGFGPFADTQTVDFDALGRNGLFMVSGPTGAGKTTVLDAICFALFGETTGEGQATGAVDGRSGEELRCSRCTDDQPTEVELEFTCGEVRMKVKRNPEYSRAAKRGGGTTLEQSKVNLYRWDAATNDWLLDPARGQKAVNIQIAEAIGLSAEQFRRVIIIPQGRFRDVLVCEHSKREELLKSIFDTGVYVKFEAQVKANAQKCKSELEALHLRKSNLLEQHPWTNEVDPAQLNEQIQSRVRSTSEKVQEIEIKIGVHEKQQTHLTIELATAKAIAKTAADLQTAKARLASAQTAATSSAPCRSELAAATRATEPARALKIFVDEGKKHVEELQKKPSLQMAAELAKSDEVVKHAAMTQATTQAEACPAMNVQLGMMKQELLTAENAKEELGVMQGALETNRAALEKSSKSAKAKKTELELAMTAAENCKTAFAQAQAAFLRGAAGRLAGALKPAMPCPVCGSTDHPAPAIADASILNETAINVLQIQVKAAENTREKIRVESEQRTAELIRAEATVTTSIESLAELPPAVDTADLQAREETLRRNVLQRTSALTAAQASLDASRHASTVAEQNLSLCSQRVGDLEQSKTRSKEALDQAMQISGYDSIEGIQTDTRDAVAKQRWSEQIKNEDNELLRTNQSVKTLTEQLGDKVAPDTKNLDEELKRIDELVRNMRIDRDEIVAAQTALTQLSSGYAQLGTNLQTLEAQQRLASGLQQFISGNLGAGASVSLHAWVLGAVLEQVVQLATIRMREFSRGRYNLVRSQQLGDGRARGGLDIDVFDTFTGTQRHARTLSGGETFLASLALALALAEVAQQHQGGRRLETVFIDEGFGTLDPETIDLAMNALCAVHQQGRVVGVISHVEEMKRQIPTQLQVHRDAATGQASLRVVGV